MQKEQENKRLSDSRRALLQAIPKVDTYVALLKADPQLTNFPGSVLKKSSQEIFSAIRGDILAGKEDVQQQLEPSVLRARIVQKISACLRPKYRRVINGTGVIIHTNLGRAILPHHALEMLQMAAAGYSNLEFDLATGKRGSRYSLVEELLCELTGAESALVVNNNAAAVLLVLESLAKGRQVVVSRGQLVEIGGSFRIPDVMARSGAQLVEVGATNRTHLKDYENAITGETALLLKVHCSNYRMIGFVKEVTLEELVTLGHRYGLPVVEDLGSGCFVDLSCFGLRKEPTVREVVAAGADVVTFSGDKLLGGPQAGVILGRRKYLDNIKKNPLNRALRIDKFTLASLESILRLYRDERKAWAEIPTLAMIAASAQDVAQRAQRVAQKIVPVLEEYCLITVEEVMSRIGGGAMPEQDLPSSAVVLRPKALKLSELERSLRLLEVPIIGRIEEEKMILDMRTVADSELLLLAEGICSVFRGADGAKSC